MLYRVLADIVVIVHLGFVVFVVLGAVAPVPWRSPAAEAVLTGKTINEQVAGEAADAAVKNATPMTQNAYKVQLARTTLIRAIMKAVKA